MAALKIAIAAIGALSPHAALADEVERWRPLIGEASVRFGVPEPWIERVMRAESRGRLTLNGRPITSRAGAMGLMQLMPATWADMRGRLGLGSDPHAPRDNVLAGTFYLRLMYDRYGYPGLFAAYNAGPARYAEYLAGARRLPAETRGYLLQTAGGDAQSVRGGSDGSSATARGVARLSSQTPTRVSGRAPVASSIFFTLSAARSGDEAP